MSAAGAGRSEPVIYLVHGEDEFASAQYLAGLQVGLGDASLLALNLTRLDGRTLNLDDLRASAWTLPFLAPRRLVILERPTANLEVPESTENQKKAEEIRKKIVENRKKLIEILEKTPPSTRLALVEYKNLTDERDRKKNKLNWLEEWAFGAGERVLIKRFDLPRAGDMTRWIIERAKNNGGQFSRSAAAELANLVGNEPRQADQEIIKLLTYVNYSRPVEREDVLKLTSDNREGDIFILVDAIGNRHLKGAMAMLQRLLEQDEPAAIFFMIVRQYRLLLQAREILDGGGIQADVARELRLHPFVAEKITAQARRYTLPLLEQIYHRLLDADEAMKTSRMPDDLFLQVLVGTLGGLDAVHADPEMVG